VIRASDRFDTTTAAWLAGLLPICAAIGVLSGIQPLYGILAAGGALFAAAVLTDLALGFMLFTAVSFLDLLSSTGSFSGTKVIGLILFASWVGRITTRGRGDLRAFVRENPYLVVALVAMLGWCALSFAWAESPSDALNGTSRYALDMMLLPIAFAALREPRHVVWVLGAFVVGAVISALYGFAHPASDSRATGTVGDPNAEGVVLAAAVPLVLALGGVMVRSSRAKLLAALALVVIFAGLVSTLSREALLSFAAVMVGAVLFGGRWRRQAAVLLVIGATATVSYFFVFAPLTARERVTMSDTSGRSSIWTVGWRVIKAHPLLGVGNDNFIVVSRQYIDQPGALQAGYFITTPKVAHDAFIEAGADLGIPGVITLVAVLALGLAAPIRASWMFEGLGDRRMELLSRAVVLSLVAILTSEFFVAGEYEKSLWIVLALGPVLLSLAHRAEREHALVGRPSALRAG